MEREKIRLKLSKAIQNSGYNLSNLAYELGISLQRVQNYATGKTLPALVIFANICKILKLDANKLFKGN